MDQPDFNDRPHRTVKMIVALLTVVAVGLGAFSYLFRNYHSTLQAKSHRRVVHVLSYSSLVGAWSAGPSLQREFETINQGAEIEWIDGGDSRSLLKKLRESAETDGIDLVIGLDQFAVKEARTIENWKSPSVATLNEVTNPDSATGNSTGSVQPAQRDFPWNADLPKADREKFEWQSFDWAPLTLIYRDGEILPPHHLNELSDTRFRSQLAWIDPRSSTVGFQFFAWILALDGDHILETLRALLPSRQSIVPNWSTAYGLFKNQDAKLAFSFITSPVYHWKREENHAYKAAPLEDPLPFQVEYAAIPDKCRNCKDAQLFIEFLKSKEAQTILMNENFMLPIRNDIIQGTPFQQLPHPRLLDPHVFDRIDPQQILEIWARLSS